MTNNEIIELELALLDEEFEWDGENLFTFLEWKKRGYSVQKGQKAFLSVGLWKKVDRKTKNEEGEETTEKGFIKKTSHLFTIEQVAPIEEKAIKKKTTKRQKVA